MERKVESITTGKVRLTVDNWIGLAGLVITIVGGLYFAVDRRFTYMEAKLADHEQRLIRREANAFTSQDAHALSNNLTRLSTELAEVQKNARRQLEINDRIDQRLDEMYGKLLEIQRAQKENSRK